MHTEIFSVGFQGKIFDTKIVAALARALDDEYDRVRTSTVEFFTTVMAQGVLHGFYGIFTPKYSQGGFGTRYFRLRSLLHLNVH